ncbi:MAG: tetratricopeptide repeat protein [Thainema sp.]
MTEAAQLNQQAKELFEARRYEEAALLYEQVLAIYRQILGEDHQSVAQGLDNLALLYVALGLYEKAEYLYEKVVEIQRQILGEIHLDLAVSLNKLAALYKAQGRYEAAELLYQQSLNIELQDIGEQHLNLTSSFKRLAALYQARGRYEAAELLYQQSLNIELQVLGEEHPTVAASLINLAALYVYQGRYEEAEPLYQQSLDINQQVFGEQHLGVAVGLINLAALYRDQGRYVAAETLYQQSLDILQDLGEQHPIVAASLNNLAALYQDQGRYEEAELLYQQSLDIRQQVFGEQHPTVATSLNNLAMLYDSQGRYEEAELLYQQSLDIRQQVFGKQHPDVATSLNNLAGLYHTQGRYEAAESLYQQSLDILQSVLGEQHPTVAASLNNLAGLYHTQGRYREIELLYQQSLDIRQQVFGEQHPTVAASLNNLAALYQDQGRYEEAEPLFLQSLDIFQQALGDKHPDVAASLNNLAGLYQAQGRYEAAEPLYQQSLNIRQQALGEQHPGVADSLNNLARLYQAQERYEEAELLFLQSLDISKQVFGEQHPDVAGALNNLAVFDWAQNNLISASDFLSQGLGIEETNISNNLVVGSEQQRQDYIATISATTDATLSLNLQSAPTNPQASHLALETLLRRKGRILDATTNSFQTLRQQLDADSQALLEQYLSTQSQLSALLFRGLGNLTPDAYRQRVADLKSEANQLEVQLSRRSAEFRAETQPITLEAVQAEIPADAVLVEYALYEPFNPRATAQAERWGEPRYAAYILTTQGTIHAIDIGEAAPIDQLAAEFRRALQVQDARIQQFARDLDAVLMQPIRDQIGNAQHILLSPDGQLNLIPFAALVDEQNRYLVETHQITYLTSGRDLLRLQTQTASQQPPVLLANPNYDSADPSVQVAALAPSSTVDPDRGDNRRSDDLATLTFGSLPGTAVEADAIIAQLAEDEEYKDNDIILLTEASATENAVKQVRSPQILHIATHGFFMEDIPLVANADTNSAFGFSSRGDTGTITAISTAPIAPRQPTVNLENPLLRSGLALAGFNPRQSGSEDGVLTALEASSLDLRGTQLVVLSACETGVGDVANGEGVYGLRRAFVIAGAESQLTSLWKVSDQGTADLMTDYYQRLLNGEGRSAALRQTQLELLSSSAYRHPYYWAAFIPSGNWRPLRTGTE